MMSALLRMLHLRSSPGSVPAYFLAFSPIIIITMLFIINFALCALPGGGRGRDFGAVNSVAAYFIESHAIVLDLAYLTSS